jgi:RNA polymerase sigma-70 factor, ECF subfamily
MTAPISAPKADVAELEQHRAPLLKFALLQVRNRAAAEDLVQDTFAAAIAALARFEGRSSLRTWLTRILLNKIADHLRASSREISLDADGADEEAEALDALFRANGRYVEMPRAWAHPDESLSQSEFFEVLEGCVAELSRQAGRVFLLRELMGLSVDEICKEVGISASNCSVMLHRTRTRLRICLEKRWFGAAENLLPRGGDHADLP